MLKRMKDRNLAIAGLGFVAVMLVIWFRAATIEAPRPTGLPEGPDVPVRSARLPPTAEEAARTKFVTDSIARARQDRKWEAGPPDGSWVLVRQALKVFAHDPKSIEIGPDACIRVGGNPDNGWLLDCTFRGKNGFGGLILTTERFRVIRVDDDEYAALPVED